jgi:twitching motility protein PilT
MSDATTDGLLGRLAVHYKLVTLDQLSQATREHARAGAGQPLGQFLVAKGIISPGQLEQLLKVQREYVAKNAAKAAAPAPAPAPAPAAPPPAAGPVAGAAAAAVVQMAAQRAAPRHSIAVSGSAEAILERAVAEGASDIHFHVGSPIRFRVQGVLRDAENEPLTRERSDTLVGSLLKEEHRAVLAEKGQIDFAYTLGGIGRFRGNAYRQQRGLDCVLRAIPEKPPTLADLGLPASLAKFTNFHQGMVLLTGPAGCGKSSTLASLVNIINDERRDHIITVEDPIEYVHAPKRCAVNQRQVGAHTKSFARALRAALREDPDIIALGELRDLETISLALTAAETGHLVLATLHTNNAIRTVNRLLGVFPPEQQAQIRTMVSESLRAVVSQRLIPRADGKGRTLALEVLVVNKAVGNLIRENKTFQIRSAMQTGVAQGMVLLDDALRELVTKGVITREEAMKHAEEPAKLKG